MNEYKLKHMEMIQGIITRMNSNSFQIKNWAITLVSALMALYGSTNNSKFVFVALLPIVIFWFLDAYYLQQERKYRGLFNDVAGLTTPTSEVPNFSMKTKSYTGGEYCLFSSLFSITLVKTYLLMIILVGVVYKITSGN
ncbi:hypothetical protein [Vibrio sp. M260112]|uniref:hypothetical protein n=1 Tax=Vibrio sp. M260112 TaxID=3020895 RepID=UPI002F3EAE68